MLTVSDMIMYYACKAKVARMHMHILEYVIQILKSLQKLVVPREINTLDCNIFRVT